MHAVALEDYIAAMPLRLARSADGADSAMLRGWRLVPVVAGLRMMRAMALVNPGTLIAELGALSRFANPRRLMAYLGLVPSEHSIGQYRTRWSH